MSVEIKVDQELQGMISILEEQAPAAMSKALDGRLLDIVNEARDQWPVRSGASQRALRMRVAREGEKIVYIVEDRMPYSGAIQFKGSEVNVAEQLVFGPVEDVLDEVLEEFGDQLFGALGG
jgi:hypothetical protein